MKLIEVDQFRQHSTHSLGGWKALHQSGLRPPSRVAGTVQSNPAKSAVCTWASCWDAKEASERTVRVLETIKRNKATWHQTR